MTNYINQDEDFQPIKVGKPGKLFELLISRIEAAKKIDESIQILSDENLINKGGRKRQFDVVLRSLINDFLITIAIECKEHERPVDVDKIESFEAKCQRIPEISKKVFVSNSGYTDGAIDAALDFGIELINIEELSDNEVLSWTKPLNFYLQKRYMLLKRFIAENHEQKVEYKNFEHNKIEFHGYDNHLTLNEFCTSYVIGLSDIEWNGWFKDSSDRTNPIDCSYMVFPQTTMEIGCIHQKSQYWRFYFLSEIWQEDILLTKSDAKSYKRLNKEDSDAVFMELDGVSRNGEKAKGEIIYSPLNPNMILNITLIEGKEIVAKQTSEIDIRKFIRK